MNKTVPILIVTTLGASFACLHLVHELRQERAKNASLQSQLTAREQKVAARNPQEHSSTSSVAPIDSGSTVAETASEDSGDLRETTQQSDELGRRHEGVRSERERLQDPAYRSAVHTQLRATLSSSYPGMAAALGLPREQAEQLLDLLATQQLANMENPAFVDPAQDPAVILEHEQLQRTELEIQLGPTMYRKWVEYQQTLGERHSIATMQSTLALAGTPMSAEQSDAVLAALLAAPGRQAIDPLSAHIGFSGGSETQRWLTQLQSDHQRLLAAIKPVVSLEQYEHLERHLENELAMQRANAQLNTSNSSEGSVTSTSENEAP